MQATGLQLLHEGLGGGSTGRLLRELEAQHPKSCDTDMAGCGALNPVNHFLESAPRVFTLQLAWESHSEQPADIAVTLAAIDEEVGLLSCAGQACFRLGCRRMEQWQWRLFSSSSSGTGGSTLPTHCLHVSI